MTCKMIVRSWEVKKKSVFVKYIGISLNLLVASSMIVGMIGKENVPNTLNPMKKGISHPNTRLKKQTVPPKILINQR